MTGPEIQELIANTLTENEPFLHDPWYVAEELMDAFNDAGHSLTRNLAGPSSRNPYEQLAAALNTFHARTGTQMLSITFDRSETPIDWDENTGRWVAMNPDTDQ